MTKKITGSTGEERLEQFFEHYVSFPKVTKWAPVRRNSSIGKTWCGPYALAVISNTPYEFAYAKSKKVLGKRAVMRMSPHQFIKVAKAMSVNCQRFWREREADGCTVGKLRDNLKPGRLYAVEVTGHFIVVDTKDWTVCDNQHGWTSLADWPHRRARCRNTLDCTTTEIHWPDTELGYR
jgi:hypothetical protein